MWLPWLAEVLTRQSRQRLAFVTGARTPPHSFRLLYAAFRILGPREAGIN
jgi:hypothetical protein